MRKKYLLPILAIAIFASLLSLVLWQQRSQRAASNAMPHAAPSLIDQDTLRGLRQSSPDVIDRSHLAPGLTPPTNKWFSGFALQAEPKPGYAYPNSYRPTTDGLEVSLPKVTATKDSITGPHAPDVRLRFEGATGYKITRYDELTVDLTYYRDKEALAVVTLASGVPYTFVHTVSPVIVSTNLESVGSSGDAQMLAGAWYGIMAPSVDAGRASLKKGQDLTVYSAPDQHSARSIATSARHRVVSGMVKYVVQDETFRTILHYETADSKPTIVATLPHHGDTQPGGVRYKSIYGDLVARSRNELEYSIKRVELVPSLAITNLTADEKASLRSQLTKDVTETKIDKPDTYFAGKQFYRAAQLLDIAVQLNATDETDSLKKQLNTSFDTWLRSGISEKRSFYYDSSMRGVVGDEASFGSDKEFNDHHFHYGYFIYAAAVLARYDDTFVRRHGAAVNLLVADIANYRDKDALPLRRNFDPYASHSWASGNAPFADGNNQESVSEAINAWTGVALWGRATKNKVLEETAVWMLSNELATARAYWFQANPMGAGYLRGYTAPLVSINWGGKRGYQTFFSNEPNAKLGIQLIPMNPTMAPLSSSVTNTSMRGIDPKGIFSDYILMAHATTSSIDQARALPDGAIDDGNSRTYLYAWMMTH
jgi:endo-1,3(4)-beta-glucanase